MEQKHLMEDFRQLFDTLQHHPLFIDVPRQLAAFQQLYEQSKYLVTDLESFITAASTLTTFFCDGHTNIEIPYTKTDLCLPIPCKWQGDQLITTAKYQSIPKGAKIIALEGIPIANILDKLASRIPHENIYLVKSRTAEYPYRNYHLFSDLNLAWLFGEKTEYQLTVETTKENIVTIPLVQYNGFLDFNDNNFVSWKTEDNHAVLRLDACICNEKYALALANLSAECRKRNIQSLTLDLSRNMGGTSEVIEKFLEYVDIDTFHRYEMIDYSSGIANKLCSRTESIINNKKDQLFPKSIDCKVGNTTFSSARTFAVTLKDNGIATIIGEPTGGKPSSYGMPRKYTLTNTGLRFRVSCAWFGRPNASLDSEDALYPD